MGYRHSAKAQSAVTANVASMVFVVQRADYLAAVDWVADLMEETGWDKLSLPTPCKEFDVWRLMGLLIGTAYRGLGTATGEPTTHVPHVVSDVADVQLPAVYRDLAGELRATWSLIDGEAELRASWGTCTAEEAARGFTVETLVHGWDLAEATGRPSDGPPGVGQRCLAHQGDLVPARLRGKMYDDPVEISAELSATRRLAHHLGRAWPE